MSEQMRIDEQLDQLVAERTSELAAANDGSSSHTNMV